MPLMRRTCLALLVPLALGVSSPAAARAVFPGVALAEPYHQSLDPSQFFVSEKLDGARAYWDGRQLRSRSGAVYHAPDWFTAGYPDEPLDGELWMGRGRFQELMSVIRDRVPDTAAWRAVRYHVFDLPAATGDAVQRQQHLSAVLEQHPVATLEQVPQTSVESRAALYRELDRIVALGGEGLVLQSRSASYQRGRHDGLLKLTPYDDAEATVIGYTEGRGRLVGRIGALVVEDERGRLFKLGSGLSDAERDAPPPVGSRVTYRFSGRTARGLPRFARYLRVRPTE